MGYGIQPFQMSGGAGDCVKEADQLHLQTPWSYLGVDVSSSFAWNSHIGKITRNTSRTFGFLKRNIKTKMPRIGETAYNTLVRPQLEYSSTVWDPYTKHKIYQIEMVQRRAARWTCSNYDWTSSVTEMIKNLVCQALMHL